MNTQYSKWANVYQNLYWFIYICLSDVCGYDDVGSILLVNVFQIVITFVCVNMFVLANENMLVCVYYWRSIVTTNRERERINMWVSKYECLCQYWRSCLNICGKVWYSLQLIIHSSWSFLNVHMHLHSKLYTYLYIPIGEEKLLPCLHFLFTSNTQCPLVDSFEPLFSPVVQADSVTLPNSPVLFPCH